MQNTRYMNGNIPWYIKASYQFGIPAVIAGFLVWALVTRVDGSLTLIKENLVLHAQDSAYTVKELERVKIILQQICANTSETVQDRNSCFQSR